MVATVSDGAVLFRAKTILPHRTGTSINEVPNKKTARFDNGRIQVINLGYSNELIEMTLSWNPISEEQKDQLVEDIRTATRRNLPLFWVVPPTVEKGVDRNLWECTQRRVFDIDTPGAQGFSCRIFSVGNLNPIPAGLRDG